MYFEYVLGFKDRPSSQILQIAQMVHSIAIMALSTEALQLSMLHTQISLSSSVVRLQKRSRGELKKMLMVRLLLQMQN